MANGGKTATALSPAGTRASICAIAPLGTPPPPIDPGVGFPIIKKSVRVSIFKDASK